MFKFALSAVIVCLAVANFASWGVHGIEGDTDLNDLQDTLKKSLKSQLPDADISSFEQLNSSIPALDEGNRVLKEKCQKNSQLNNSYEIIMESKNDFEVCVKDLVDLNTLKEEIKKAEPSGDVDMVFKKYCKKSPELKECVVNFTSTMDICLDKDEKDSKTILQSVTEALLSFVCHDDGDRIALFYSEGGPDCLLNKKEAVNHCFNKTFGKYVPSAEPNMTNLPSFKFEEDQCKSMHDLQLCVVNELIKCSQPTPGNIVESLFEFVRRSTPCSKFVNSAAQNGSEDTPLLSMISVTALGVLTILLGRMSYE